MRARQIVELLNVVGELACNRAVAHRDIVRADEVTAFIVFSKDRPMQLDALLRSVRVNVVGEYQVYVQWSASTREMASAYRNVFQRNKAVITAIRNENEGFEGTLRLLLEDLSLRKLSFLVDDILFVRPFDLSWLSGIDLWSAVPTLRLGPGITHFQTTGRTVPAPKFKGWKKRPWLAFSWVESQDGWAMPVSLDGHIFLTSEIRVLARSVEYRAPNSLEGALNRYRFWFKYRTGLCLPNPAIVNFAFNRVQSENQAFPCGVYSSDFFLEQWNAGFQLDISALSEAEISSCHVVTAPVFERRSG